MKFDPWEIGEISDYEKLFSDFGMESMELFRSKFSDNPYIRRKIVFGQRGFKRIAQSIDEKKPFVMMTGLMPSGSFHFGHKMVADQIIWYQSKGAKTYIAAADIESYHMRNIDLKTARDIAINEYLANYLALGLSEKNLHFWFQSDYVVPYYRFRDLLANRATFNELKALYGDLNGGKILSVLTQVADILHPQLPEFEGKAMPTIVPVGADQDPHIRLTRDIASRIKNEFNVMPPAATYHRFMEGLHGGKMSSSDPKSHIALSEDPKSARKKIMSATTGGRETAEEQKKLGGKPDVCSVYKFYFYHLVPDDKEVQRIYQECTSGSILCGECKKRCADMMEKFLTAHQKKLEKAKKTAEKIGNARH